MDSSAYAFTYGIRHTRETLREWQRAPGTRARPLVRRLGARRGRPADGGLGNRVARAEATNRSSRCARRSPSADLDDVVGVLARNMLVLALHAMACVAGFIAGSSLPLQVEGRTGVSRWVHEHGGRLAIAFVIAATTFSLSAQAYLLGHTLGGVAAFLRVSPGLLLLGVLPHALPELIALFLPLAAWIIASRRGEWEQLLAATFVTVAFAVPILVVAAFVEVYVSPHLFTALTHIHPPIMRASGGWIVTVR